MAYKCMRMCIVYAHAHNPRHKTQLAEGLSRTFLLYRSFMSPFLSTYRRAILHDFQIPRRVGKARYGRMYRSTYFALLQNSPMPMPWLNRAPKKVFLVH